MKRILFALFASVALVTAAPPAEARAEVSVDFFYNNLTGGNWVEVEDYGYCWQPGIAVSNRDWRPYTDGYWAYTDVGWTWVSYEDFGWATYHYGRWARVRDHGWLWVPGREWGPAWVSWRTGGDYVGWAPLPPRRRFAGAGEIVYEGRPIYGQVDIEFDIGPAYYNFVDIRYIGAPVLRQHIYEPTQNITYISRTVNVTNITYNNSVVYNHGPDYDRLSAYSTRPIQRLTLQRQTDIDLQSAVRSGGLTKVQGNQLIVAAPPSLQPAAETVAPKNIKTKIAKPDLETGWMGVANPTAKAELQEKMKKEDPKSVPPPQIAPQNPAALQAGSTPPAPTSPNASPATAPTTAADPADAPNAANDRGKGRNKRALEPPVPTGPAAQRGVTQPNGDSSPTGRVADPKPRGKDKRATTEPQQRVESAPLREIEPPSTGQPTPTSRVGPPGKRNRVTETDPFEMDPPQQAGPADAPAAAPGPERGPKNKNRRGGGPEVPPVQQPAGIVAPPEAQPDGGGRGRGKQKKAEMTAPSADVAPPPQMQREDPRRNRPGPPVAAPQQIAPAAAAQPAPEQQQGGRGKPDKGEKEKGKKDK